MTGFFKRCGQSHHSDSALRDQQFSDIMKVQYSRIIAFLHICVEFRKFNAVFLWIRLQ